MDHAPLLTVAIRLPTGTPDATAVAVASMAGRLGFTAVHLPEVPADPDLLARLAAAADPALVVVDTDTAYTTDTGTDTDTDTDTDTGPVADRPAGLVRTADPAEVRAERARLDAAGTGRPLLVAVPVSVGRTLNEATARADLEPRFAGPGHPRAAGIFGAFDQAQEQVLALAAAGADGLLLDVPLQRDVADVLAQVRALVVGAAPELLGRDPAADAPAPPRTVFYG